MTPLKLLKRGKRPRQISFSGVIDPAEIRIFFGEY
jgi:hypothetical protein